MRVWSQQLLVKNCIFWVQNVLSRKSKILMDILLLRSYTRFSFSLKKCNLQQAKITILPIHPVYPIQSPPTG